MKLRNIAITGMALAMSVLTQACRENAWGTVDLTPKSTEDTYQRVAYQYAYNSRCALWSQADFDRVKASLDNGTAPAAVQDEFEVLKNNRFASKTYSPTPYQEVRRGSNSAGENYTYIMYDAAASYQLGLLWKLTGDEDYAKAGVNILNQYAATLTALGGSTDAALLTAQGYQFAVAGGIFSDYANWSESEQEAFRNWTLTLWAPRCRDFLDRHNGTCDDHYWSNWDLLNMCCYFAVGVLNHDDDIVNYIVNYFHDGNGDYVFGNGCIKKLIVAYHDDPLGTGEEIGQNQESGRDQGHAQMSMAVTAVLCQMAYTLYSNGNTDKQELDFFSSNDYAIMKMAEYVALSNLRDGKDQANANGNFLVQVEQIPFETYYYCGGANQEGPACTCTNAYNHGATHTQLSDGGDRGSLRPGWEIIAMHYSKVRGKASGYMYSQAAADKIRPEYGSGNGRYTLNSGGFDQTGWNTLMMYRE